MLLGSLDLLTDDPAAFVRLAVVVAFSLIVAITIHEFSHALVASGLGDNTAKRLGRLSLNPVRHMDRSGTVMMLVAGFGWGKPVPVNEGRLRYGRQGVGLVAAAGPLANLFTALFVGSVLVVAALRGADVHSIGFAAARIIISISIILTAFNFLPIPPLDGFSALLGILPPGLAEQLERLRQFGPGILMAAFALNFLLPINLFWTVMSPIVAIIYRLLAMWERILGAALLP